MHHQRCPPSPPHPPPPQPPGKIAGLDVLRIINEPTAASLAYGIDKKTNETILVFDLGGGTFDVSILEVGDGVFEVLSTSGDTHLGGDDFDKRIVDYLSDDFQKNEGIDLRKDRQALQRLTEAAEKAKIELSSLSQTSINLPFITATADGPKHIDSQLTRAKFEEMCSDLLDRCRKPVEQSLRDAKLSINGAVCMCVGVAPAWVGFGVCFFGVYLELLLCVFGAALSTRSSLLSSC